MIGRVVSVKSKSTATVLVEREASSKLYGKTFVRSKKYLVDDPIGVKDGDMVEIEMCRPISKRKQWKINKVLGKNIVELAKAHLKKKSEEVIAEVMSEEKVEESSDVSHQTKKEVNEKKEKSQKRKDKSKSLPRLRRVEAG